MLGVLLVSGGYGCSTSYNAPSPTQNYWVQNEHNAVSEKPCSPMIKFHGCYELHWLTCRMLEVLSESYYWSQTYESPVLDKALGK